VKDDSVVRRDQLVTERDELSRTVAALADRLDVGSRARDAVRSARGSGVHLWQRALASPLVVPAAAVLGAAVVWVVLRAAGLTGRDQPRS
jgi:hypothetical protein